MIVVILAVVLALGLTATGADAQAKIRVVTSLPDLKALTEAVGGDLVEVESLARGTQNPHDIEVRPSLMLKLRRADLFVRNGVGGDPWVEPLLVGGQNAKIFPARLGYVDASVGVPILAAQRPRRPVARRRASRGQPTLHARPRDRAAVTANIVEGLKRVAPGQRSGVRDPAARISWLGWTPAVAAGRRRSSPRGAPAS